jgi:hypothetical protein
VQEAPGVGVRIAAVGSRGCRKFISPAIRQTAHRPVANGVLRHSMNVRDDKSEQRLTWRCGRRRNAGQVGAFELEPPAALTQPVAGRSQVGFMHREGVFWANHCGSWEFIGSAGEPPTG